MGERVLKFGEDDIYGFVGQPGRVGCIFTNGCFDILHRGHIELFKFCRAQREYSPLVVGVNSDKSIRKLKGRTRPIMPEEDRVSLLSAIKYIDCVVIFDTKSVLPLIEEIKPAILVKGGSYNTKPCAVADQIVGQEFVENYGGKVLTAPLVEGVSSTNIIERIKNVNK